MSELLTATDQLGQACFPAVLRLSVELAVLAVGVAGLIWLLRIRSPRVRHLLWLLVLLKPLVFVAIDSPWTLFGAVWETGAVADVGLSDRRLEQAPPPPVAGTGGQLDALPAGSGGAPLYAAGFLLWIAGVAALLVRIAIGYGATWHLRRTSSLVLSEAASGSLEQARKLLDYWEPADIGVSSAAQSPVVTGILRPLILLPEGLERRLDAEKLTLILAHELAHVRRLDNLVLLAQRLLEALLFFHPAVWLTGRQLRREAERACDDAVRAATGHSASYADGLTTVAEAIVTTKGVPAMDVLTAAESNLSERVRRILDTPVPRVGRLGRLGFPMLVAGVALSCLPATSTVEPKAGAETAEARPPVASAGRSPGATDVHRVRREQREALEALSLRVLGPESAPQRRRSFEAEAAAMIAAGATLESIERLATMSVLEPAAVYYYGSEALDKVATNPAGTNAQRFVVVSLQLGIADRSDGAELLSPEEMRTMHRRLKPYEGLMKSIVTDVLMELSIDDLTRNRDTWTASVREALQARVVTPHLEIPDRQLFITEVIVTDMIIQ